MASMTISWNYVIIYVIVLVIDVLVASAIALWKCSNPSTPEECDLAICGIVGSAILWLLLWFVIPSCLVCFCKAGGRLKSLALYNASPESPLPDRYNSNLKMALSGARPAYVIDGMTSYKDVIKTPLNSTHLSITCITVCETDKTPLINDDTDNR